MPRKRFGPVCNVGAYCPYGFSCSRLDLKHSEPGRERPKSCCGQESAARADGRVRSPCELRRPINGLQRYNLAHNLAHSTMLLRPRRAACALGRVVMSDDWCGDERQGCVVAGGHRGRGQRQRLVRQHGDRPGVSSGS